NIQISRHAPGNRFITLFYGVYDPAAGDLVFVNAGHTPPLLMRANGGVDRPVDGGVVLGMFDRSPVHGRGAALPPAGLPAGCSEEISWRSTAMASPRPKIRRASRSTSAACRRC